MEIIILFMNIIIYSIFGFFMTKIFRKRNNFSGFISPEYALFGLLAMYTNVNSVIWLYISGIMWAIITDTFLETINKNLKFNINYIWYGVFNIFNYYILNQIVNIFIINLNYQALTLIFIFSSIIFILDISYNMRKMI